MPETVSAGFWTLRSIVRNSSEIELTVYFFRTPFGNGQKRGEMSGHPLYVDKATPDPEENSQIGIYSIGSRVSRTKFSIIYAGSYREPRIGDPASLTFKFVKRYVDETPIHREIELYKDFCSDRVVPLLDNFVYREFHCLVFPSASGGDLEHYMQRFYPLGIPEVVGKCISTQFLEMLGSFHAHHIVHCDVKPANILVPVPDRIEPKIWVCDFGLSRDLSETKATTTIIGTSEYQAPEVFQRNGCMFLFLTLSFWKSGFVVIWRNSISIIDQSVAFPSRQLCFDVTICPVQGTAVEKDIERM
jgi:serine/threonine protein kinase